MNTNTVILQSENLSIGYRNKTNMVVANALNLSLRKGTLYTLIGANGSGKSTLLRTLCGLQPPLEGNVQLGGKEISSYSPNLLAQSLSLVLTDTLPQGNLSVYELVSLGRQPYTNWIGALTATDRAKVDKALLLTDTYNLSHKKVHELSDGQLQNVLIARALAQDTNVIVLDEPTTHLDLPHKVALLKLLRKLAEEEGKCILYSTHDLDLALQLSNEIIILKKGGLVQGTLAELQVNSALTTIFDDPGIVYDKQFGRFIFK